MDRRWIDLRVVAEAQHGAFTLRDADRAGLSDRAVRSAVERREVGRVLRGGFAFPDLVGLWTPAAAACLVVPHAVVSHRTAGAWWDLDGLDVISLTDMTVPDGRASRQVVFHRSTDLAPFEVRHHGVLRVTDPTRTLIDAGAAVDLRTLELATESALRQGLTSEPRLLWRARQLAKQGRSGPRAVLRVLDRRTPRLTGSAVEVEFLQLLRDARVERPVRQLRVRLPSGVVYLDTAWPDAMVFAEIDGYAFHSSRPSFQRDRSRQNELVVLGWLPLRFTRADVARRGRWVVETVTQTLARRRIA